MKTILITLAAVLCCAMTVSAQGSLEGRNRTYRITLNKVQYAHHNEKMSAGDAVEGVDISRCKVQSGGKDIKAALDAGQQLQVISID